MGRVIACVNRAKGKAHRDLNVPWAAYGSYFANTLRGGVALQRPSLERFHSAASHRRKAVPCK